MIKIKDYIKFTALSRKKRMKKILFITFFICFALIVRIGIIQFVQGADLKEMAYMQQTLNRNINPKRGTIFDCTEKNILAMSATVETVSINPRKYRKF